MVHLIPAVACLKRKRVAQPVCRGLHYCMFFARHTNKFREVTMGSVPLFRGELCSLQFALLLRW
jgi:hypothetical protein